ncbi:MAG: ArsC family transcriptional regulator [Bacteroidetes bacterium]|nr:ArsC family transcriptional regulator [Bacteroidota bacterium]
MNIIIIGTKKCRETQKAERYFKERRVPFHFRDLNEKGLSKGELENITAVLDIEEVFDENSDRYKKLNMQYMVFDKFTKLLDDSLLLKTPVVRNGKKCTVGYEPETWKKWIEESK